MSDWFDTAGAARYLGVSPNTLRNWRTLGRGPRFYKIGALVKYRASDLDAFVREIDPPPSAPASALQVA